MSDELIDDAEAIPGIDLDTDTSGELDVAMREALRAIELGAERGDSGGSEDADSPAAGADESGAPGAAGEDGSSQQLQAAVEEHRERALRTLADFENYRKRVQRERQEERRFRALEPLRSFLPVVDNLERALASDGEVNDLKTGVEMILKQMENLLRDHGVERVQALGEPFDPSVHEAVSRHEEQTVTAPTVSEELQAGYTMHDRLLRPAVVKVAMPVVPGGATAPE